MQCISLFCGVQATTEMTRPARKAAVPIRSGRRKQLEQQDDEQEEQEQAQEAQQLVLGELQEDGSSEGGGDADADGAPGPVQHAGSRRSFAAMLGSTVDDAELRAAYRGLPGQRITARKQLLDNLKAQAPRWHLLLRCTPRVAMPSLL